MTLLRLFFGFKGRITRSQYWLGMSGPLLVFFLLAMTFVLGITSYYQNRGTAGAEAGFVLALFLVVPAIIASIWIALAVTTKRLHDRGKGAIWLLLVFGPYILFSILVLINIVVSLQSLSTSSAAYGGHSFGALNAILMLAALASQAASLWAFVELGCLPGSDEPNRFDGGYDGGMMAAAYTQQPYQPSQPNGMESAMAAVNAAAREDRRAAPRDPGPATPAQIAQRTAPVFGQRGAVPTAGGVGRKGL